jgi:hypothetical protein
MTFSAGDRALFSVNMASLAVHMEGLHQRRCAAGCLQSVAIGAILVFGRLTFYFLAVFIEVVTLIAVLNTSHVIVFIVSKESGYPLRLLKVAVRNPLHILL